MRGQRAGTGQADRPERGVRRHPGRTGQRGRIAPVRAGTSARPAGTHARSAGTGAAGRRLRCV